jgi:transcriptional regulator with XRE-family HTH domain
MGKIFILFVLFFLQASLKIAPVMRAYREFPQTLRRVIEVTHGGKQSDFAHTVGMTAASISRLCAGTREISKITLEKITQNLCETHRRKLYLAAIRDFLPSEGCEMFFPNSQSTPIVVKEDEIDFAQLDPEIQKILEWLGKQARYQKEVRSWLKTLANWINPE